MFSMVLNLYGAQETSNFRRGFNKFSISVFIDFQRIFRCEAFILQHLCRTHNAAAAGALHNDKFVGANENCASTLFYIQWWSNEDECEARYSAQFKINKKIIAILPFETHLTDVLLAEII